MTQFFKDFLLTCAVIFVIAIGISECARAEDRGPPAHSTALFQCEDDGPHPSIIIVSWGDGTTLRIYSGHMEGLAGTKEAMALAESAEDYVPLVPEKCTGTST